MAFMGFTVQAAGIPFAGAFGLAAGDVAIAILSGRVRVYTMSSVGEVAFMSHIQSNVPFRIQDDPVLQTLSDERIDFSISGTQAFFGDLSLGFKVYNREGDGIYDLSKLVETYGTSLGGWTMSGTRLRQVRLGSDRAGFLARLLGFRA